jgi:hypothetical protein
VDGGVVSGSSAAVVVAVTVLLGGEAFGAKSRATTLNVCVVPGASSSTEYEVTLPTSIGVPSTRPPSGSRRDRSRGS